MYALNSRQARTDSQSARSVTTAPLQRTAADARAPRSNAEPLSGFDLSNVQLRRSAPVMQRVNDDAAQPVAINWNALTAGEAAAYQAKIAQGWTANADEIDALAWIAGGRAAVQPAGYAGLAGAAVAAGSTPGGTFAVTPVGAAASKLGWVAARGAPAASIALIENAFREMRNRRSLTKRLFERQQLLAPGVAAPGRPALFGAVEGTAHPANNAELAGVGYAQLLDAMQDEPGLLAQTAPFVAGTLVLAAAPGADGLTEISNNAGAVVGYLTSGAAATYHPMHGAAVTQRPVLGKRGRPGKAYVHDNRGTVTSRYAYCEKNFWQFMDFLTNGRMEGRFQTFSRAIGAAAPSLFAVTSDRVAAGPAPATFSMEQMAVLHQWKGTGPEQRGLSLTSTSGGVVVGNAGESFRSAQGFRLTIDLARVPPSVILVNHFATAGVRSQMGAVNPRVYGANAPAPGGERYNYDGSVAKNRELFLERLEPAWISEVVWHGAPLGPQALGDPSQHAGGTAGWMAQTQATTGHDQYSAGFAAMLALRGVDALPAAPVAPHAAGANWVRNRVRAGVQALGAQIHAGAAAVPPVPGGLSAFEIARFNQGVSAARHYLLGHYHGRLRAQIAGVVAGPAAPMEFGTVTQAGVDVGDYNNAQGGMEHIPEIYSIGFAHATSGQAHAGLDANFLGRGRAFNLGTQPSGPRGVVTAAGDMQHVADVSDLSAEQPTQTAINLRNFPVPAAPPPLARARSASAVL